MQWDYTRLAATNVLIGYTRYSRLSTLPLPPSSTGLCPTPALTGLILPPTPHEVPCKDESSPGGVCTPR